MPLGGFPPDLTPKQDPEFPPTRHVWPPKPAGPTFGPLQPNLHGTLRANLAAQTTTQALLSGTLHGFLLLASLYAGVATVVDPTMKAVGFKKQLGTHYIFPATRETVTTIVPSTASWFSNANSGENSDTQI